jgi:serine/threonine protein kinase
MDARNLGHFSLIEKIGEGGMGRVYRARDLLLDRLVVDPLCQHLLDRVLDPVLSPPVEKTFRQAQQEIQTLIGLTQQQRAPIGTDCSAVEAGYDLPPSAGIKSETRLDSLCHTKAVSPVALTVLRKLSYAMKNGLLPIAGAGFSAGAGCGRCWRGRSG